MAIITTRAIIPNFTYLETSGGGPLLPFDALYKLTNF